MSPSDSVPRANTEWCSAATARSTLSRWTRWGEAELLIHDEHRDNPGLAFQLSRLSRGPYEPTPIGVFRDVERPDYGAEMSRQIDEAIARRGAGDLDALLRSGSSWTVE